MKIPELMIMLLIVGGLFFFLSQLVAETNNYFDSNISADTYDGKYDYVDEVNSTIEPLKSALDTIQDEDAGWFSKLTEGISAIPTAIILIPSALFDGLKYGGQISSSFMNTFLIPEYLILLAALILIIWGIFKLVEIFQRWQT